MKQPNLITLFATAALLLQCSPVQSNAPEVRDVKYPKESEQIVDIISEATQQTNIASNQDPTSVVTYKGAIYYVYINTSRQMVVAKKIGNQIQRSVVFNLEMGDDEKYHICPTIGIDKKGYVHITGDMHSMPWKYFRSNNPEDITSFTRRTDLPGNGVTYPTIMYDNNGEMYICFRHRKDDGTGGDHRGGIIRYDADTDTFKMLGGTSYEEGGAQSNTKTLVWSDGFGAWDGFYLKPGIRIHFDSKNRMHLMATQMGKDLPQPHAYASHSYVIYAYSDDYGNTWKKIDGTPISSLPLTPTNSTIVVDRMNECDINGGGGEIGVLANGNPVISYNLSSDKSNHSVRWNGSSWVEIFPPNKSATFMSKSDGTSAWCDGKSICYTKDGAKWESSLPILPGGSPGASGGIDREHFKKTGEFRYHAKYNNFSKTTIVTVKLNNKQYNIVKGKSATASSSFTKELTPDKAVDGDVISNNSRWTSAAMSAGSSEWIEVDLAGEFQINTIGFMTGHGGTYSASIVDFEFQVLENGAWKTIISETNNDSACYGRTIEPVSTTKVRLKISKVINSYVRLYELVVYGIPQGK